ncbi:MAG: DNA topoisomerase IB [Burkholderiaceae bacterium]
MHIDSLTSHTNGTSAPASEAPDVARQAGLRYVTDDKPGIRRISASDGYLYTGPNGEPVDTPDILARIKSLAIPPAWTDVWICMKENGHLQATGRDARGRKQYRYHPRWRAVRDENKYDRMAHFAQALPLIRSRVEHDMGLPGMPREKVLATVVHLLEVTMMRVGNEEYARQNRSYGLTTLRDRHVQIDQGTLQFRFRGKSGVKHSIRVADRRLARIVRQMRDLPGQTLFQYVDDDGALHPIDSSDVNGYLREIAGQDYTAKDFRTWAGTMLAALALREAETFESEAQAKRIVSVAVGAVAERLGNTPAVCRKCYIHPVVLDAYRDGSIAMLAQTAMAIDANPEDKHALNAEEQSIVALLLQHACDAATTTARRSAKPRSIKRKREAR